MRVSFYTLGCKVNQAETKQISEKFAELGYSIVPFSQSADVVVINTCSVTHIAERKSRNLIRRALKLNSKAHIVVCGCYANLEDQNLKIEIPEIAEIIPQNLKLEVKRWAIPIPQDHAYKPEPLSRFREFLKVQDGCDQFCSYCVIPYARSELISIPQQELLNQVAKAAERGVTEIILTGINLGKYSHDLPNLLRKIAAEKNIQRIRLSSIEPNLITNELLTILRDEPKLAKHLHIPLQSGSDKILKAMNRRYNTSEYLNVIAKVRSFVPDISITTDIILGFPTDNTETFQETLNTVAKAKFSDAHLFKYSKRSRTKAAELPQNLKPREVDKMFTELSQVIAKSRSRFVEKFIAKEIEVLIEQAKGKYSEGLTSEYIRVLLPGKLPLGQIVKVKFEPQLLPKRSPSAEP